MIFRDYVSWWLRPGFLRGGPRKKRLFAGPWVGEFGWELMHWQGFVRAQARHYEEVIVSCRPGNEALYRDFATAFEPHSIKGTADCGRLIKVDNPEEVARILSRIPPDADHLKPMGRQPHNRQEFLRFGTRREELATDILFHPRGRTFGTDRNWDQSKWNQLVASLIDTGLRVGCIGLTSATLDIGGDYRDYRDLPLDQTFDRLASTRLVVGPSSGPMHLAALTRTPVVVWTDRKGYAGGMRNRDKYERDWNPLGSVAIVLDDEGFDPTVRTVLGAIGTWLKNDGAGLIPAL